MKVAKVKRIVGVQEQGQRRQHDLEPRPLPVSNEQFAAASQAAAEALERMAETMQRMIDILRVQRLRLFVEPPDKRRLPDSDG